MLCRHPICCKCDEGGHSLWFVSFARLSSWRSPHMCCFFTAGAINTPQILLLSGLGPTANLSSHNISTIVDLPYVGSNLQDHVLLGNSWQVNSNLTFDDVNRNQTLFNEDLEEWRADRKGLFASSSSSEIGWLRLPDDDPIFKTVQDPSAGKLSGHYEFIFIVRCRQCVHMVENRSLKCMACR